MGGWAPPERWISYRVLWSCVWWDLWQNQWRSWTLGSLNWILPSERPPRSQGRCHQRKAAHHSTKCTGWRLPTRYRMINRNFPVKPLAICSMVCLPSSSWRPWDHHRFWTSGRRIVCWARNRWPWLGSHRPSSKRGSSLASNLDGRFR